MTDTVSVVLTGRIALHAMLVFLSNITKSATKARVGMADADVNIA